MWLRYVPSRKRGGKVEPKTSPVCSRKARTLAAVKAGTGVCLKTYSDMDRPPSASSKRLSGRSKVDPRVLLRESPYRCPLAPGCVEDLVTASRDNPGSELHACRGIIPELRGHGKDTLDCLSYPSDRRDVRWPSASRMGHPITSSALHRSRVLVAQSIMSSHVVFVL